MREFSNSALLSSDMKLTTVFIAFEIQLWKIRSFIARHRVRGVCVMTFRSSEAIRYFHRMIVTSINHMHILNHYRLSSPINQTEILLYNE